MNDINLPDREEAVLWNEAARRLLMIKSKPSVATELVNRLQGQLPAKRVNETFAEFIRRASSETQLKREKKRGHGAPDQTAKLFTPLSEFVRLAADSSGEEISLPDPNYNLESEDGRFRLIVRPVNEMIQITIQALGFASDEFSDRCIAIANPADNNKPIAIIKLDQDGDGVCTVEDSKEIRQALLNPVLLLVNE